MAVNYAAQFKTRVNRQQTPQSQPIPGSNQVANSGGGFSWQITPWQQLERFLILGAEGGTFYIQEQDLVKQNHSALLACIKEDGAKVVSVIEDVSLNGRAYKNDPAVFALALVATHGSAEAKAAAYAALPKVCRIGTHLFHFAEFVNSMRNWSGGLRRAFARWYVDRKPEQLALQVVKYQSRDRWSHRDILRLAHVQPQTDEQNAVFRWVISGNEALGERQVKRRANGVTTGYDPVVELPALIQAFEKAKTASEKELVSLILEHGLPREAVPTEKLNSVKVWEALLQNMPMTAMIRNLGKMTAIGLLAPMSAAVTKVVTSLGDAKVLKKARIHPMAVLLAQKVYAQGHGDKGSLKWNPVSKIVDALDAAFYTSFGNVVPSGKPVLLALDVSGSMDGSMILGTCLSAREASAAMALVTMATEPACEIIAFAAARNGYGGMHGGGESGIVQVSISPKMRLDTVIQKIRAIPMGGTDCALPMLWAARNKVTVDGFVTYTDSETWAGSVHPSQALRDYRNQFGRPAKAVTVGMTSNGFSICDPKDAGSLDVAGFDAGVPSVIADFIRGGAAEKSSAPVED